MVELKNKTTTLKIIKKLQKEYKTGIIYIEQIGNRMGLISLIKHNPYYEIAYKYYWLYKRSC